MQSAQLFVCDNCQSNSCSCVEAIYNQSLSSIKQTQTICENCQIAQQNYKSSLSAQEDKQYTITGDAYKLKKSEVQSQLKLNVWKNRNILDLVSEFLENKDICNLQQVNEYFNQFNFNFSLLKIKKQEGYETQIVNNKIKWVLRQIANNRARGLKICTQDLSNRLSEAIIKYLDK